MDMEKMIVVEKSTKWWLTVATGGALAVGLLGGYGLATAIHGTKHQQSAIQQPATMPGALEQGQNAGNGMPPQDGGPGQNGQDQGMPSQDGQQSDNDNGKKNKKKSSTNTNEQSDKSNNKSTKENKTSQS